MKRFMDRKAQRPYLDRAFGARCKCASGIDGFSADVQRTPCWQRPCSGTLMDMRAQLPRLLLAASGPAMPVMQQVWQGHVELRCALYMEDARRALDAGIDIVLCTLHFDESSMFELLRYAQSVRPKAPFVCCRARETKLRSAAIEAARLAALARGAACYVDLPALQRLHGSARGAQHFREVVLHCWDASYRPQIT